MDRNGGDRAELTDGSGEIRMLRGGPPVRHAAQIALSRLTKTNARTRCSSGLRDRGCIVALWAAHDARQRPPGTGPGPDPHHRVTRVIPLRPPQAPRVRRSEQGAEVDADPGEPLRVRRLATGPLQLGVATGEDRLGLDLGQTSLRMVTRH
jgi:hypothetical protein